MVESFARTLYHKAMQSIKDFTVHASSTGTTYVSWKDLEDNMDDYEDFKEWMFGQTCIEEGAYSWDVERYFRKKQGLPVMMD